jgi:hypothetical protein
MKVKIQKPVEVEVTGIRVVAAVRYDEEDIPNNFPFRKGDIWDVTIDLDTGKIRNWVANDSVEWPFKLHMKVCDQGSYHLLGPAGEVVASIEEDYVPNDVVPGSYGDYIEMTITSDGTIQNWGKTPIDLSEFFPKD